jgi:glutamate--cysteine ligase
LHLSGVFTDVRSYRYIEVRTADLVPDDLVAAVPALWTGLLYQEDALDEALELGSSIDDHRCYETAMMDAARRGLDADYGGRPLREVARDTLALAARSLAGGAACGGDPGVLERLDRRHRLGALDRV